MANTKDYAMREMIYDQCFGTGREYTREQLMAIVNRKLEDRGMLPIQSRTTFSQDITEMNAKFAITAIATGSTRYIIVS